MCSFSVSLSGIAALAWRAYYCCVPALLDAGPLHFAAPPFRHGIAAALSEGAACNGTRRRYRRVGPGAAGRWYWWASASARHHLRVVSTGRADAASTDGSCGPSVRTLAPEGVEIRAGKRRQAGIATEPDLDKSRTVVTWHLPSSDGKCQGVTSSARPPKYCDPASSRSLRPRAAHHRGLRLSESTLAMACSECSEFTAMVCSEWSVGL